MSRMWAPALRQNIFRIRLRHAAQAFAGQGWAVTPGGYFNGRRMACDRPTCWATSCHPLLPDWETATVTLVGDWWHDKPHSVLLPTGRTFDAIEVPALVGSCVRGIGGPVIITPNGNWIFLVSPGLPLRTELEERMDIVHHGAGSWVPAPPTVLPEGAVRWHISPRQVGWQLPDAREAQSAVLSALVALDASFLDRPCDVPARMVVRHSTMEAALRRVL
jgi:Bifunctional DNA primase/polymerase, N-terminal